MKVKRKGVAVLGFEPETPVCYSLLHTNRDASKNIQMAASYKLLNTDKTQIIIISIQISLQFCFAYFLCKAFF